MTIANQINTLDPNALADLKRLAGDNSPEAIRAAAQQFEALFLQMVMKSMREATPAEGMFDNEQSRMYLGLLDQQLATNMAQSRGVGLADALVRQLGGAVPPQPGPAGALEGASAIGALDAADPRSWPALADGLAARRAAARALEASGPATSVAAAARPANAAGLQSLPESTAASDSASAEATPTPDGFVDRLWPHAVEVSRETGIPARFLIAHAALETGWGRGELRHADGRPSHNLFNIKAGTSWKGETVSTATTEYAGSRAYTEQARFRSYDSYAEAFRDYARLLGENPRYAAVLGQTDAVGFARGLQDAGYATDPMYADKLARVIGGKTLRSALATSSTTST